MPAHTQLPEHCYRNVEVSTKIGRHAGRVRWATSSEFEHGCVQLIQFACNAEMPSYGMDVV